jgi:hypothetical protein
LPGGGRAALPRPINTRKKRINNEFLGKIFYSMDYTYSIVGSLANQIKRN